MLMPVLGLISFSIAVALQYTPVFLIDFTQTPESVQVLASYAFFLLFAVFMLGGGWVFYREF